MPILGTIASSWKSTGIDSDYYQIATTTVVSDTSIVTFNNIASTWTNLELRTMMPSSGARLRFNNASGASDYRNHYIYAQGSSVVPSDYGPDSAIWIISGGTPGVSVTLIPDYKNSSKRKSVQTFSTAQTPGSTSYVWWFTGQWTGTAAITRIDIVGSSGSNIKAGSVISLYGMLS